jgi:hypothetical protein
LKLDVKFADCIGDKITDMIQDMRDGDELSWKTCASTRKKKPTTPILPVSYTDCHLYVNVLSVRPTALIFHRCHQIHQDQRGRISMEKELKYLGQAVSIPSVFRIILGDQDFAKSTLSKT